MKHNTIVKSTPKDVFLHLLNILTFYISIIGLITLYVQYINVFFPDPLNFYYTGIANSIRWATSVLVIAVPIYLLLSWLLTKEMAVNPEKRELKLRKWLVYFTLFISAVTIIVDLITFVYNFLNGELTTRFFLKILVVFLVAGAVFGYYIWELRRKKMKSKTPKILAGVVSLVVLASVIGGFFLMGTPADQRKRRFDEQRVNNLQALQSQIVNYWIQKEELPLELDELEDSISGYLVPNDPQTDLSYEYYIIDPLSFELCAKFETLSDDFGLISKGKMSSWKHEAGRVCFERTIDPELYDDEQDNKGLKEPLILRD